MPLFGGRLELFTPFRLAIFGLGFAVFFLLLWWKNSLVAPSADVAVVRALREVTSARAEVVISSRYPHSEAGGRSDRLELACGGVGDQAFAAKVRRRAGSRGAFWRDTSATTYEVEAMSLAGAADPALSRPDLLSECKMKVRSP